ncbi:uncharacterized protein LOC120185743 [Hibiscus syriacus]|uniref:uncharacterized protein LOC120185743 n=1 Tax=Hibiscus syriacus TaxID=106335 RepID=UPI001923A99C|nr:uncharacterized protein LOC120185743 [Hibiscus syriacus]
MAESPLTSTTQVSSVRRWIRPKSRYVDPLLKALLLTVQICELTLRTMVRLRPNSPIERSKAVWEFTCQVLLEVRPTQLRQLNSDVTSQCWCWPTSGLVKINSDGAHHRALGVVSCGVLFRIAMAGGFSVLPRSLLCQGWWIHPSHYVDSLEALKEVSDSKVNLSRLLVAHHIAKLLEGEWTVRFKHVPRHGNRVADCLDKMVDWWHYDCVVLLEPPLEVRPLLDDDLAAPVSA